MIDSLINRERKCIVIDRLYIKDEAGEEDLIVEKQDIMSRTNLHFQTVTGGSNEDKVIPDEWKRQYSPKSWINDDIYEKLMDPISDDELINTIHNLADGKAAGPSKISNEMIKNSRILY